VLFHDHPVPGRPELFYLHHLVQSFFRVLYRFRDNDPFTLRQAVGLEYDRGSLFLYIILGFLNIGESPAGGAGDAVSLHQVFGEDLARLYLGGFLRRAEDGESVLGKEVDDAVGQRLLRPDYG
jgi:hypothetical protein